MNAPDDHEPEIDLGTAGASARREYERRRAGRERRTRERHPRLGGGILALKNHPRHERAWARGAGGEEAVAASLAERCKDTVVLLHDRRVPGSRANIDHIAVAPSGVWVIDSKRYKGKVAVSRPLFGKPKLMIAGRDKTKLADGLATQVALVQAALQETAADVPVHGAMCFIDADLPLVGTLKLNGFALLYRKALARRLNANGPLGRETAQSIATQLAERFPPA
jgi:hypothetical protein